MLPMPKPQTYRDERYLEYIRQQPCIAVKGCQAPSVPHHHGPHGMGIKADDYRTVPLCRAHHGMLHNKGRDRFQQEFGVSLEEQIIIHLMRYIAEVLT